MWRDNGENFPNMKKKKNLPSSESIQSFRQHKPKQEHAEMHRNQTDKKFKTKKKYLKKKSEKQQITFKEIPVRLSADFSAEILQARRE